MRDQNSCFNDRTVLHNGKVLLNLQHMMRNAWLGSGRVRAAPRHPIVSAFSCKGLAKRYLWTSDPQDISCLYWRAIVILLIVILPKSWSSVWLAIGANCCSACVHYKELHAFIFTRARAKDMINSVDAWCREGRKFFEDVMVNHSICELSKQVTQILRHHWAAHCERLVPHEGLCQKTCTTSLMREHDTLFSSQDGSSHWKWYAEIAAYDAQRLTCLRIPPSWYRKDSLALQGVTQVWTIWSGFENLFNHGASCFQTESHNS